MHVSNASKSHLLWVVATSNSPRQLLPTNKPKNQLRTELRFRGDKHKKFTTNFEFYRKVQEKHKWLVFVTEESDLGTMHPRRYSELSTDLGPEACTLFCLGTYVWYTYVSVGVKLHSYHTISKHRYELAVWFFRKRCTI